MSRRPRERHRSERTQYLTWSVYGMTGAPEPKDAPRDFLTIRFGEIVPGSTGCLVCRAPLDFALFHEARRGKAEIETAHAQPRSHTARNVGFAHRNCNKPASTYPMSVVPRASEGSGGNGRKSPLLIERAGKLPERTEYAVFNSAGRR